MEKQQKNKLAAELEIDLTTKHGVILSSAILVQVLGYSSPEAFRQSLARKTVPVLVFRIPNRRGHFALAKDVAVWLAQCRETAKLDSMNEQHQDK
ncbi:MAG: hypothetical protein Q7U37_11600 [Gallionella sp.]|nr:hypothetical protein [Gallionella sp.]MDP1941739.1 hypothetical protein [Gallionella sp.]